MQVAWHNVLDHSEQESSKDILNPTTLKPSMNNVQSGTKVDQGGNKLKGVKSTNQIVHHYLNEKDSEKGRLMRLLGLVTPVNLQCIILMFV